jgi:hypothetical protein
MKEGAKPCHGKPYPIAQVHNATLMKEINRLEGIGVPEAEEAIIITMGLFDIYHPKEGYDSADQYRF